MVDASDRIRKRVAQTLAGIKQNNVYSPYSGQTYTPNFTPGETAIVKQSPYGCTNACSDESFNGALFFSQTPAAYVQVTNSSELTIGTNSFTIEWWQYMNSPPQTAVTGSTTAQPYIFGFGPNNPQAPSLAAYWNLTGPSYTAYSLTLAYAGTTRTYSSVASTSSLLNRWVHVAVVGVPGATPIVYINGVSRTTSAQAYNITNSLTTYPFFVIGNSWFPTGPNQFPGFITDFRFTIGTAVYTAAFTPPKQPLVPLSTTYLLLNAKSDAPLNDSSQGAQTVTSGTSTVGWDNVSPYYALN